MLVLSTLHNLLTRVLEPPSIHTAVLLTPSGQLVSLASEPQRPKDDIRIIAGLAMEVWQETKDEDYGMADSELGRILVLPVDEEPDESSSHSDGHHQPLMILVLNASNKIDWDELQLKGGRLVEHLSKPLSRYREYLEVPAKLPPSNSATSPPARQ